jgi:hypothetical protein
VSLETNSIEGAALEVILYRHSLYPIHNFSWFTSTFEGVRNIGD